MADCLADPDQLADQRLIPLRDLVDHCRDPAGQAGVGDHQAAPEVAVPKILQRLQDSFQRGGIEGIGSARRRLCGRHGLRAHDEPPTTSPKNSTVLNARSVPRLAVGFDPGFDPGHTSRGLPSTATCSDLGGDAVASDLDPVAELLVPGLPDFLTTSLKR